LIFDPSQPHPRTLPCPLAPSPQSLSLLFQIPVPVQGEGKRAWRARVRAVSTQSLTSIQFRTGDCVSHSVSKIHAHLDWAVRLRLDPRNHRDCVGVVGPWRLRIVRAADDDPSMERPVAPNNYFSLCSHHLSSLNHSLCALIS
jgi:hypothetical protein